MKQCCKKDYTNLRSWMLSVLSCSIELREKVEEDKGCEDCDVLADGEGARAEGNSLAGSSEGAGAGGSREGERVCSSWELRPLARAITAY